MKTILSLLLCFISLTVLGQWENANIYGFKGKTIYVSTGGDVLAAKNSAQSGDTVFVGPGLFTTTNSLSKSNVNWWLSPGCTIAMTNPYWLTLTNSGQPRGIFDDIDGPVSFSVGGYGDLFYHAGFKFWDTNGIYGVAKVGLPSNLAPIGAILITNALSDVQFQLRKIKGTSHLSNPSYPSLAWIENCKRVDLTVETLEDSEFGGPAAVVGLDEFDGEVTEAVNMTGVYWALGDFFLNCKKVAATSYGLFGAQPVGSNHVASFWANVDNVTNTSGLATIYFSGSGASLRWKSWINAKEIGGPLAATGYGVYAGGSHYLTAQKVLGNFSGIDISIYAYQQCSFWCNVQKVQAVDYGIRMDLDPNPSATFDMQVNHILQTGAAVAGLKFQGGGTMRLSGTRFSSTNLLCVPVVKFGTGYLHLSNCNLNNLQASGTNCAVCIITNSALSVAHSTVVGPTNKFGFLSMATNSFRAPFTLVNCPSTNLLEITSQLRTNENAL